MTGEREQYWPDLRTKAELKFDLDAAVRLIDEQGAKLGTALGILANIRDECNDQASLTYIKGEVLRGIAALAGER